MSADHAVNGRVIAITGGARGIGFATAQSLHARGARVAIGDIDRDAVVAAAAKIGPDVLGGALDVTDPASFAQFVALVERELGPLDVLVNNAGIMPLGRFVDETEATGRRALQVNVMGCMTGMKLALPGMLDRGRGHIVNVASVAGKAPAPGGMTYCATKAAVVSLTETARVEYRGSGVSFTCVMPSFTNTELIAGTKGTKFVKTVEPQDVAEAIASTVARPRADVYVPGSLRGILALQHLTGRRIRDAMNRTLGADRTFLEVDAGERAAYEGRIAAPAAEAAPAAARDSDHAEASQR